MTWRLQRSYVLAVALMKDIGDRPCSGIVGAPRLLYRSQEAVGDAADAFAAAEAILSRIR